MKGTLSQIAEKVKRDTNFFCEATWDNLELMFLSKGECSIIVKMGKDEVNKFSDVHSLVKEVNVRRIAMLIEGDEGDNDI